MVCHNEEGDCLGGRVTHHPRGKTFVLVEYHHSEAIILRARGGLPICCWDIIPQCLKATNIQQQEHMGAHGDVEGDIRKNNGAKMMDMAWKLQSTSFG